MGAHQAISSVAHANTWESQAVDRLDVSRAASLGRNSSGQVDLLIIREFANKSLGFFVGGSPVPSTSSLGCSVS